MFANTPSPPYYAVIFTSKRTYGDHGYGEISDHILDIVKNQPGFLGLESVRSEIGITVSYWKDIESIKAWSENVEHQKAKDLGKSIWYKDYRVRICKVEKEY